MKLLKKSLVLALMAASTCLSASAQTLYFGTSGNGGSGNWDTSTLDWATAPAGTSIAWTNGDSAIFNTAAGTVTIGATAVTAAGLTFNLTGYTISSTGGALTLANAAPIALTGTTIISAVVTGTAPVGTTAFTTSGTGTLDLITTPTATGIYVVGGTTTLEIGNNTGSTAAQGFNQVVSIGAGATLLFDANANQTASGSYSGAGNLVIGTGLSSNSAGYLGLSPSGTGNTISGTTTINFDGAAGWPSSELFVNSATSLSPNSLLVMLNGNLDFRANDTVAGLTGTNAATEIGTDGGGNHTITINLASGTQTYSGELVNFVGNVSGTFGVTKTGAGTEILSGANTYTGTTTIAGGTLEFKAQSNASPMDVTGGTLLIVGAMTGASQNFTIGQASGSTALMTLHVATGSLATTDNLNFNGAGTFNSDFTGVAVNKIVTLSTVNFLGGSDGTVEPTWAGTGTDTLKLGSVTRNAGGIGNFTTVGGTNGTNIKITSPLGNFGTSFDQGTFWGLGAPGGTYAFLDSSDFIRAFNYATDGGTVTAGGATLGATNGGSQVETTGAITAQTTATVGTVQMAGATGSNTIVIGSGQTLTAGGILLSGATGSGDGSGAISGGTISAGVAVSNGTATDLVLATNQSGDKLTVSSVVTDAGDGLTVGGPGTVTLLGANTYTGNTAVDGGTLNLGNGTIGNLVAAYAGNFIVGGNLNFDLPTASTTFSGTVSGPGTLTQMANTVILNGTVNGLLGNVVVNSGATLQIGTNVAGNASASGFAAAALINSGGTLIFDGSTSNDNLGVVSTLSGAGNLQIGTGTGSFTTAFLGLMEASNTVSGTTTVDIDGAGTWPGSEVFVDLPTSLSPNSVLNMVSGRLDFRASDTVAGITGSNPATLLSGDAGGGVYTLTVNTAPATSYTYAGAISNTVVGSTGSTTLGITMSGSGTQILTGALTYGGTTTVNGGTLNVASASSGTGATNVNGGGTLLVDMGGLTGTGAITNSAITAIGASGASLATVGGNGTIDGATIGNFGVLSPGDPNDPFIGTPAKLTLNSSASVTMNTGATLSFVLNGPTAGTLYSQLNLGVGANAGSNAIFLNGIVNLQLTLTYAPTLGANFLLTNDSLGEGGTTGIFSELNGTADTLNEGSTFQLNGDTFSITYLAGAQGGDVELTVTALAVPEPSSLALLGAGLVALLGWNVRRYRSKQLFF